MRFRFWQYKTNTGTIKYPKKPKRAFPSYRVYRIIFDYPFPANPEEDALHYFFLWVAYSWALTQMGGDHLTKFFKAGDILKVAYDGLNLKQRGTKMWTDFIYYYTMYQPLRPTSEEALFWDKVIRDLENIFLSIVKGDWEGGIGSLRQLIINVYENYINTGE